jgi:hypothetical protein
MTGNLDMLWNKALPVLASHPSWEMEYDME